MDTHGHHVMANVGEKLLRGALQQANPAKGKMRIGAFYLGNWLTDVSQCVDPVAYNKLAAKVDGFLDGLHALFTRMLDDVPSWIVTNDYLGIVRDVRRDLDRAHADAAGYVQAILKTGRDGDLAKFFHQLFYFVGYCKFVHPARGGSQPDMEPDVFKAVFAQRFAQYFPHEHLDRPEVSPDHYDVTLSYRPLNHFTDIKPSDRDLYTYLRNDIALAAGILADLDAGIARGPDHVSWARGTFHPAYDHFTDGDGKKHPVDDNDVEWNLGLARLGHAFHAAEDFFAHSNFVDHAHTALPASYRPVQRLAENEVLARRLKKWKADLDEEKWRDLQPEKRVVTGYFDFRDTLVSVGHMFMDAIGRPTDTAANKIDDALEHDYAKLLRDTLEFCDTPRNVWEDRNNNPGERGYDEKAANGAVKWLREHGGRSVDLIRGEQVDLDRITSLMLGHTLLKGLPSEVRDAFRDTIKGFGAVIGGGITLYRAFTKIVQLVSNPIGFLTGWVSNRVVTQLRESGELYVRNLVATYIGAKRIGCHSLLSKDTDNKVMADASNECAKAVHWYMLATLLRHGHSPALLVPRSTRGDGKTRTTLVSQTWIDWLELLEYFLSHPFASFEAEVDERVLSVTIPYVTAEEKDASGRVVSKMSPDTLKKLADEFGAPDHFEPVPGGPVKLTWEVLADWNFLTQGMSTPQRKAQINKYLEDTGAGLRVSDRRNYAWKPGVHLTIPYQRAKVPVVKVPEGQRRWWYEVITRGHDVVAAWYKGRKVASAPDNLHHPVCVARADVEALIKKSRELQKQLEDGYR